MRVALLGASGHGKVVADALFQMYKDIEVVFFDDAFPNVTFNAQWVVAGNTDDLINVCKEFDGVVITIGNNNIRLSKQATLESAGANLLSVIHPKAVVSPYAVIGNGVVVLAGAVINAFAVVGNACVINSNSVVEHDVKIFDGVHVCPGANVAGGVVVEKGSWIGIGSCIKQLLHIGQNAVIGAGAVVVKNVPDNATVIGSPAELMR